MNKHCNTGLTNLCNKLWNSKMIVWKDYWVKKNLVLLKINRYAILMRNKKMKWQKQHFNFHANMLLVCRSENFYITFSLSSYGGHRWLMWDPTQISSWNLGEDGVWSAKADCCTHDMNNNSVSIGGDIRLAQLFLIVCFLDWNYPYKYVAI